MAQKNLFCPACAPNKIRSHFGIYLNGLFDVVLQGFAPAKPKNQLPRFPSFLSFDHWFYGLMALCQIVRFHKNFNKQDHYPRSWVVIEAAREKKIPLEAISISGRISNYYRARFGRRVYYYDALPSRFLNFRLDNKSFVKKTCAKNGLPVPPGASFWSAKNGLRFGKKLGFPLAIKPESGTHAYHVTAPVGNENELEQAIRLAKQYHPRFIVERYLTGHLYRITVINFEHVFAARREAPSLIGDGARTIKELVKIKNRDPRRGERGEKSATLHKLYLSEEAVAFLKRSDLSPDSRPAQDQKIFLQNKVSIGSGGDIFEETPLLHPENKAMFCRAAKIFGTDLVGFDFIAQNLTIPWTEQGCGLIEANSLPMIDFHHNPTEGQPHNVAGLLWDEILRGQSPKREG